MNFDINNIIPYRFGNSFEVLYPSLISSGIKAKLKGVFKNGGRLNFEATYFNYELRDKTPQLFEVINLPEISLQFDGTLKISNKIFFQLFLRYIGDRTNSYRDIFLGQNIEDSPVLFETLDSFTQIDANVQYQLNDRWEIFLRGKNLMNQNEYFWSNYRVYPSQISLGLKYNFDVSF
jgi:outer membrane receptor protein involved in Fe transport